MLNVFRFWTYQLEYRREIPEYFPYYLSEDRFLKQLSLNQSEKIYVKAIKFHSLTRCFTGLFFRRKLSFMSIIEEKTTY